jgi:hypothetical protein
MQLYRYCSYFLVAGAMLLSGCAVYVPTVPSTPLVRQGQAELGANLRAFSSLEANIAYSPLNHLLVNTEVGFQQTDWSETKGGMTTSGTDWHRQANLGLGTYYETVGPTPLYLAGVVGLGYASAKAHTFDPLFLLPQSFPQYQTHYLRYYGQVYFVKAINQRITTGGSIRATWVRYGSLEQNGVAFDSPGTKFFLEPTFFGRIGRGPLQLQGTLGWSMPTTKSKDEVAAVVTPTSLLLSIGVIFRPHLLGAKKAKEAFYYK